MISDKNKDILASCLRCSHYIKNKEDKQFYIEGVKDVFFFNSEIASNEYKAISEIIKKFMEYEQNESA